MSSIHIWISILYFFLHSILYCLKTMANREKLLLLKLYQRNNVRSRFHSSVFYASFLKAFDMLNDDDNRSFSKQTHKILHLKYISKMYREHIKSIWDVVAIPRQQCFSISKEMRHEIHLKVIWWILIFSEQCQSDQLLKLISDSGNTRACVF